MKTTRVDWEQAEVAAARIVLAYEIGDAMVDYAGDSTERQAAAVSVLMVVAAFTLQQLRVTEKQATSQFLASLKATRARCRKLGKDATLKEILTELHLDQRKARGR